MRGFLEISKKPPFLAILGYFDQFGAQLSGWAQNESFFKNPGMSHQARYDPTTSCKISEKSNERFLRNIKSDRRTNGGEFIGLHFFRGTKKQVAHAWSPVYVHSNI